jgi:hypothetical protein
MKLNSFGGLLKNGMGRLATVALKVISLPFTVATYLYTKFDNYLKNRAVKNLVVQSINSIGREGDVFPYYSQNNFKKRTYSQNSFKKRTLGEVISVVDDYTEKGSHPILKEAGKKPVYRIKAYHKHGAKIISNESIQSKPETLENTSLRILVYFADKDGKRIKDDNEKFYKIELAHIPLRKENKKGIEALLELNLFNTRGHLEKIEFLDDFKNLYKIKK